VVSAAFLASAATSMVGSSLSGDRSGSSISSRAEGSEFGPNAYFVDSLFRSNGARAENGGDLAVRSEAGIILTRALQHGELSPADKDYLAQVVAKNTSLSPSDADTRVADVFASAKQAAETARKATAHTLLWTFLALLTGAFCASFSATIGGRQRDHVLTV
jgi:hypothetical protein